MHKVHDSTPTLTASFEAQVRNLAERPAVRQASRTISYGALNEAANRLAHGLVAEIGQDDAPIALIFGPGIRGIVAILATLKAGRAYVQMDPDDPPDRLRSFLDEAQIKTIVSEAADRLRQALGPDYAVQDDDALAAGRPAHNPDLAIDPERLAWIHFTSGSTGRPKGVMQRQGDSLRFFQGFARVVGLGPDDNTTMLHGYLSLDLYPPLLNGCCLHIFDLKGQGFAAMNRWLDAASITVLSTLPSVFRSFTATCGPEIRAPGLRMIRLGGEPATRNDVELARRFFPDNAEVLNWLGSSETGMAYFRADAGTEIAGDLMPVGQPIDDVEIILIDADGEPVGSGETGEIVVASRFLFPGYWRNAELSGAVLSADPRDPSRRLFRTGDVGRFAPDGRLEYLGRTDFRIKVRGHRVEPGEVEAALLSHPSVEQAAVRGEHHPHGDRFLAGYVVPVGRSRLTAAELKRFLSERLPRHMIPRHIEIRRDLPTTATGKIDRRALPPPAFKRPAATAYRHPTDAVEVHLKRIWEDLLTVDEIGIDDDFFELGGDSLLALSMVLSIEQQFSISLPLDSLWFEGSTIDGLARILRNFGEVPLWSVPVLLKPGVSQPPLFVVHVIGGHLSDYVQVSRHLDPDQPVYGLQARGLDGNGRPDRSMQAMASHAVDLMRKVQAQGPYRILGYSSGGLIAFEMARSLMAAGERVERLILLDSAIPRFSRRDFALPRQGLHRLENWRTAQERLYHLVLSGLGLSRFRRLRTPGEAHRWAYWSYRPQPYDGDVVLIRASEGPDTKRMEPDWKRLIGGHLTVEVVPGDHHSILREPIAEHLGACLQDHIDGKAASSGRDGTVP